MKLIDILLNYSDKKMDEYLKKNGKRKPINPFVIVESEKVHKPEQ